MGEGEGGEGREVRVAPGGGTPGGTLGLRGGLPGSRDQPGRREPRMWDQSVSEPFVMNL